MQLYLVFHSEDGHSNLLSIFSTMLAAKDCIDKEIQKQPAFYELTEWDKDLPYNQKSHYIWESEYEQFCIDIWTVTVQDTSKDTSKELIRENNKMASALRAADHGKDANIILDVLKKHSLTKETVMKNTAFNTALAGESVPDTLKECYDPITDTYKGVTHDDLLQYAKIVAYKVAQNLKNGYTMNKEEDPLEYIDCGSKTPAEMEG